MTSDSCELENQIALKLSFEKMYKYYNKKQ